MKIKKIVAVIVAGVLTTSLAGCSVSDTRDNIDISANDITVTESTVMTEDGTKAVITTVTGNSILDTEGMFSNRDLEQEADLLEAVTIELDNDDSLSIIDEGVYVLSGDVSNTTIIVEAGDEAKVQLVLDGLSISNEDAPAIVVKSADKVFVTTTDSTNVLEVTGNYSSDGDDHLDAVIYSKVDLVLNGLGILEITSTQGNGVTSKDDLKVTGGTYVITSEEDGIEANDSIRIYDGDVTILSNKDGLHSENDDDTSLGVIYIQNGHLNITAADDGIHGTSVVQIDGGTITIPTSAEGIEATYIMINDGTIDIYATDDGINATAKSDYDVMIEVNGGQVTVAMASGDTDAFDANGDITINGGLVDVTAVSSFDADGTASLNGGTVIINGETVTELPESQMNGRKGVKQ